MKKKIIIIVVLIFIFLIWFCKSFMVVKDENGNVKYQGDLVQNAESTTEILTDAEEVSSIIQEEAKLEATEVTTEVTYGFNNPAPLGVAQTVDYEMITGKYTAEIKFISAIRGDEAYNALLEENEYNYAPDDGFEYILVRASFKNIKCEEGKSVEISPIHFKYFSSDGVEYSNTKSSMLLVPDSIRCSLYEGAEKEGNIVFMVKKGDNPKISYGTKYDGTGGIWFKIE